MNAKAPLSMSDLEPLATPHTITGISHSVGELQLRWDDGRQSRFAAIFLRDNCPCTACRHPQALERTYLFVDHGTPQILDATLEPDGALRVRCSTGAEEHVSRFTPGWLRRHDPDAARSDDAPALRLWNADIAGALPVVDWAQYLRDDSGLRQWIEAIRETGIVLMRGIPAEPGRLVEIARRIGPIRGSNFGEYYDVVSMPNPNASADTAMGLEPHTDLANWASPPDVQLLCCVKNSVIGGESIFCDGFHVAELLREQDPEAFHLLSTQEIEFRFHDATCDIRARAPAIALDAAGRLREVRFNNWLRGPMICAPDRVESMYAALGSFWRLLRDPRNQLQLRLGAGELIAYNNHRVLHGRTPFDPTSGERHLQGCYVNREDLESQLRLLERRAACPA
jgi:gamma-butyrobetaine dioxygenase